MNSYKLSIGHYGERALPSSGVLPFLRTYVCELNYSCSASPRYNPPLDFKLTNLSQIAVDTLNILNQNDTIKSIEQLLSFITIFLKSDQSKTTQKNLIIDLINKLNLTSNGLNNPSLIDFITNMNFNLDNIIQLFKQPSLINTLYSTLLNNISLIVDTYDSFQNLQNVRIFFTASKLKMF